MPAFLIFGHLGMGNIGDELMLPAILDAITRQYPDAVFFVAYGQEQFPTPLQSKNIIRIPRSLFAIVRAMRVCDAFVVAGGTHLAAFPENGRHVKGILRHAMLYRLAKAFGLRVLLLGIGLGPFKTQWGKRLAKAAIYAADFISVRDRVSQRRLDAFQFPESRYQLCDDPAMLCSIPPRHVTGPHLGISILPFHATYSATPERDSTMVRQYANLIREWSSVHPHGRTSLVCFYSADHQTDDYSISKSVLEEVSDVSVQIVDPRGDARACLAAFSTFSHFISMRYHSQLLAGLFGIPQIVIAYHEKNRTVAQNGTHRGLMIPVEDFTNGPDFRLIRAFFERLERVESPCLSLKPHFTIADLFPWRQVFE